MPAWLEFAPEKQTGLARQHFCCDFAEHQCRSSTDSQVRIEHRHHLSVQDALTALNLAHCCELVLYEQVT